MVCLSLAGNTPYDPKHIVQNTPYYAKVQINEKRTSIFGVKNTNNLTVTSYDSYIKRYTGCKEYDIIGVSSKSSASQFRNFGTTHYFWIKCLKN